MLAMAIVSECVSPLPRKTDDRGNTNVYTWPTNLITPKPDRPKTEYRNAEVQCK